MKLHPFILSLFILLNTIIISCNSDDSKKIESNTNSPEIDTLKKISVIDNIPYRTGKSDSWKLDLAVPENFGEGPLPAIVIVHGGGWRFGSKQDEVYRKLLLDYAFQGYVTLSVEYRLHDEAPFPACVEDVKCAVRWLRAHADQLNVDPERIGAYGHSAGAHIVLMLAMAENNEDLEGDGGWNEFSSHLNVAIGGSTPTEPGPRLVEWNNPNWWPIGYISGAVKTPLFLIHGDKDDIVKIEPVEDFVDKMKKAGADISYLRIEGGDHAVAYSNNLDVTKPAMDDFFRKWLKK